MSTQSICFKLNLSESVIDGAELVHETIEAYNCLQLCRRLKCHGRPVGEEKKDLVASLECLFLLITKKN